MLDLNYLGQFDEDEIFSFLRELLHLIDRKDFKTYNEKCAALEAQVIFWKKSSALLYGMQEQEKYDRIHGSVNE
jgi:hypothetical protein